jgi:RNA polymerase sigma-70 factor (sigma-E family)
VGFEEFMSARLGALLRYATAVTCDSHLAEDVVQTVLVRTQAKWSRIGRLESPESYVKRMVVNEFLSWRRRKETRVLPLPRESLDPLIGPSPDPTDSHDAWDAVVTLLSGLPPRQRAVMALRFYEDMSVEAIADVLGCRPVTVRTHIARALATLRQTLPATSVSLRGQS